MPLVFPCFSDNNGGILIIIIFFFCRSDLCFVHRRCLKDFCGKKRIKDSI